MTPLEPCDNCRVPTRADLLWLGLCAECHADVGLGLPEEDRAFLEREGVKSCREAGMRAVVRPCVAAKASIDQWRCTQCAAIERARKGPDGPTYTPRSRDMHQGLFGPFEARALERYFSHGGRSVDLRSSFGEMCRRVGESTNPDTEARPTPLREHYGPHGECEDAGHHRHGAAWTEILDVGHGAGGARYGSWDDAMADLLDASAQMRRVRGVLAQLPAWAQRVLEARYALAEERASAHGSLGVLTPVALQTKALAKWRRKIIQDGQRERDTRFEEAIAHTIASSERWAVIPESAAESLKTMRQWRTRTKLVGFWRSLRGYVDAQEKPDPAMVATVETLAKWKAVDGVEWVRTSKEVLYDCAVAAAGKGRTLAPDAAARETIAAIRAEAESLVNRAQQLYARATREMSEAA